MIPGDTGRARASAPDARQESGFWLLAEVARVANEGLELRPMLQRLTDLLAASLDWQHVAFMSLDRERKVFVVEALTSSIPSEVGPDDTRPFGTGIVGRVALTGRPAIVDDVGAEGDYLAVSEGIRCEVCYPVGHGGAVVAILNFEDRRARDLAGEAPLLEAVARQLGGVVANSRLHEEVLQRAQQLELLAELSRTALEAEELEPVLQRIAERLREKFDFLLTNFYLLDPLRPRLDLKAISVRREPPDRPIDSLALNRGIVGRAIHLRRAQLVLDVRTDPDYVPLFPETVAELAIPIHFRDRLLGVFNFENDRPQAFAPETVSLLQTLSGQLAGLIHLAAVNRRLLEAGEELEHANTRLREMNRTLEELSTVDALTALPNRRQFDRVLDLEWRRAIRGSHPLSLLFIDIDFFKRYNDTHGHLRGDAALAEVAGLLAAAFTRAGDLVARYGGEEFAALLPNTPADGALELAEQARARVESRGIPHPSSDAGRVLTVSIGSATLIPDPWRLPPALVERSDRALYMAKAGGRNCVRAAD